MSLDALARRYLHALDTWNRAALEELLAPNVVQEERPNKLVPAGRIHTRDEMLVAFERGSKALSSHHYEVLRVVEGPNVVAVETEWTGVLAAAVGGRKGGDTMRASIALFLDVDDGRITRIRHYDCFT